MDINHGHGPDLTLHPSSWPEEVALPRFPPDRAPMAPCDEDDENGHGFEYIMPYGDRQCHRNFRVEGIWKSKKHHRANKIISTRPGEFGERPVGLSFIEELPKFVDPETVILWPEWMLTETGFQGFRIIGRLPVVFHGGISKRNRQFFFDITDKPKAVAKEPIQFDRKEGAITFPVTEDDATAQKIAEDFIQRAFIPWKTYLV